LNSTIKFNKTRKIPDSSNVFKRKNQPRCRAA